MPVTNAAGITVPAITWYGEADSCRLPELRVCAEPVFRNASFCSWRFCTAVGSAGCAVAGASAPASASNGCALRASATGALSRLRADRTATRRTKEHAPSAPLPRPPGAPRARDRRHGRAPPPVAATGRWPAQVARQRLSQLRHRRRRRPPRRRSPWAAGPGSRPWRCGRRCTARRPGCASRRCGCGDHSVAPSTTAASVPAITASIRRLSGPPGAAKRATPSPRDRPWAERQPRSLLPTATRCTRHAIGTHSIPDHLARGPLARRPRRNSAAPNSRSTM